MVNVIQAVENYLFEALNIKVKVNPWKGRGKLPFFLTNAYDFLEILLLKHPCLMVIAKVGMEETPAVVRKHIEQVMQQWEGQCIYVQNEISPYNRKRLIEHHVPFIIPNSQIYLPELGVVLKEHFQKQRIHKKHFSPATQTLIIFALLNGTAERFIPSEMAKKLGYTLMTMTRTFDELEDASIGKLSQKGKERWWIYQEGKRELWEQTKSMLQNPVKASVWIKHKKPRIVAGLSALAQVTTLSPPKLPTYAISFDEWKPLKESGVKILPTPEKATFELEIWRYNPMLFAKDRMVDPFSLYLSLVGNPDERIEIALKQMMEKIEW